MARPVVVVFLALSGLALVGLGGVWGVMTELVQGQPTIAAHRVLDSLNAEVATAQYHINRANARMADLIITVKRRRGRR